MAIMASAAKLKRIKASLMDDMDGETLTKMMRMQFNFPNAMKLDANDTSI
jgi:hypothetical protein